MLVRDNCDHNELTMAVCTPPKMSSLHTWTIVHRVEAEASHVPAIALIWTVDTVG